MTRMTRPDCAVMCNLINTHTHTHTHTHTQYWYFFSIRANILKYLLYFYVQDYHDYSSTAFQLEHKRFSTVGMVGENIFACVGIVGLDSPRRPRKKRSDRFGDV